MIVLIFSVCLLSAPDKCHEEKLLFSTDDGLTPYSCMMKAQQPLTEWIHFHPNYRVSKWTCKTDRQIAAST